MYTHTWHSQKCVLKSLSAIDPRTRVPELDVWPFDQGSYKSDQTGIPIDQLVQWHSLVAHKYMYIPDWVVLKSDCWQKISIPVSKMVVVFNKPI